MGAGEQESTPPSAEKVARIAHQLGVEIEYLIDEEEKITEADSIDAKFYREYRRMTPETRKKIRAMAKLIGDEE